MIPVPPGLGASRPWRSWRCRWSEITTPRRSPGQRSPASVRAVTSTAGRCRPCFCWSQRSSPTPSCIPMPAPPSRSRFAARLHHAMVRVEVTDQGSGFTATSARSGPDRRRLRAVPAREAGAALGGQPAAGNDGLVRGGHLRAGRPAGPLSAQASSKVTRTSGLPATHSSSTAVGNGLSGLWRALNWVTNASSTRRRSSGSVMTSARRADRRSRRA